MPLNLTESLGALLTIQKSRISNHRLPCGLTLRGLYAIDGLNDLRSHVTLRSRVAISDPGLGVLTVLDGACILVRGS